LSVKQLILLPISRSQTFRPEGQPSLFWPIATGLPPKRHAGAARLLFYRRQRNNDAALMHACIAIDATAKRMPGAFTGVGNRYRTCLRNYYWVLEPMLGAGLNLVDTRFKNIELKGNVSPDFADLIHEVFRCNL